MPKSGAYQQPSLLMKIDADWDLSVESMNRERLEPMIEMDDFEEMKRDIVNKTRRQADSDGLRPFLIRKVIGHWC